MTKTRDPLRLGVPHHLLDHPEVLRLAREGHTIVELAPFDAYLDEITLARTTFIEAALRGGRARKAVRPVAVDEL